MSEIDTLIGHQVGRYVLQEQLREDQLGRVYLALELPSKRKVDVKVLDPATARNNELFGRFGRELLATATINHPNCVKMLDFGDHRGLFHYLVLEHVDAFTVEDELRANKKLAWARVAQIAHQVAGALKAAHDEKIIHRALCPSNLLLLQNSEGDFVKIRDFGLSRLIDTDEAAAATLTAAGARVGSAEYMAPEYIQAALVHRRGDLYALGICMYEMLTGTPPYVGSTSIVYDMHLHAPVPRVSATVKVPPWLDTLVFRLMAKDLDDRPVDAAEVLAEIERGLGAPVDLPAVTDEPVKSMPGTDTGGGLIGQLAVAAGIGVVVLVCVAVGLMVGLALLQ